MEKFEVTEPFLDLKCGLGESPYWEEKDNILRFVDIVNKLVYRVNLNQGPSSLQKSQFEHSVSITADIDSAEDKYIFGGKHGVGIATKGQADTTLVQPYWGEAESKDGKPALMRANDGAVDSRGRFWVSAMCDPGVTTFKPEGVLFRLEPTGDGGGHELRRVLEGLTIPNGMSWAADNKTLYFTDTAEGSIFAYDYDEASGDVANKRVLWRADEGCGPDGHTQDVHGNLWVAVWGGWKVVTVNPRGEVTAEVRVPTRCPTCVAFAGEDIYITSETEQEPEKYPESVRYAGAVFKCHVGVTGKLNIKARIDV